MTGYPWRKLILVPNWTVRLILSLFVLAVLCVGVNAEVLHIQNLVIPASEIPPFAVAIASCCVSIILDLAEIIAFSCATLNAYYALACTCVKTVIWTGFLVVVCMGFSTDTYTWATLVVIGSILLPTISALVYFSLATHRVRRSRTLGRYAQVEPKHVDYNRLRADLIEESVRSRSSSQSSVLPPAGRFHEMASENV